MIANLFGLGSIKYIIGAALVSALVFVTYLYKNKIEENSYLEAQIATQIATIEALKDWNLKRDVISLERANRIAELEARTIKTKIIVKKIHEEAKDWSTVPLPSAHSEFLRERTTNHPDS